jgi:hypothetical protein
MRMPTLTPCNTIFLKPVLVGKVETGHYLIAFHEEPSPSGRLQSLEVFLCAYCT